MNKSSRNIIASVAILWLCSVLVPFVQSINMADMKFATTGITAALFVITVDILSFMRY